MKKLQRIKNSGVVNSWNPNDEQRLLKLLKSGATLKKIFPLFKGRSDASIRSKIRRLRIKYSLFGEKYRDEKRNFTKKTLSKLPIKYVFEAYAGIGEQTKQYLTHSRFVISCEKIQSKYKKLIKVATNLGFKKSSSIPGFPVKHEILIRNDQVVYIFNGDAIKIAFLFCMAPITFDLLDLDTCGSTLPVLSSFLVALRPKYLLITHGEFHSLRFKREDVFRRILLHRDITKSPSIPSIDWLADELDLSVKASAMRCHNEIKDSYYPLLMKEMWMGQKQNGMLRRLYKINKAIATSDCLNDISGLS